MAPIHEWPHDKLTKIIGKPTAGDILTLQGEIFENAQSLPNNASTLGHLGLVMPPEEYLQEPGSINRPYMAPTPPGPYIATSSQAHRTWDQVRSAHEMYTMGKVRLLAQILEAVDETWIYDLQTPGRKYTNCTPQQAFCYLKVKYGAVTSEEEDANRAKMREPWDDNKPIGLLWAKIAETCAFATFCNAPITQTDKVSETIKVLIKCPKYDRAITTWFEKPRATRDWDALVTHFDLFEETYKHITTTRNTSYLSANAAEESPATVPDLKLPSNANVAMLPPVTPPRTSREKNFFMPPGCVAIAYCHSCGSGPYLSHTSATCRRPKPGHDKTATYYNRNNGSDAHDATPPKHLLPKKRKSSEANTNNSK